MIESQIVHFIWSLIIAASVISCLVMLLRVWLAFPDRTIDDVIDFLVPLDFETVEQMLDPAVEWSLRRNLTSAEFRTLQRKRIHLYLEFLGRMTHNSAILIQCGNRESERRDPEIAQLASELQREALKVRVYTLAASAKLRLWLLFRIDAWHVFPTPSLCDLCEVAGIKGLDSYDRMKTTAGNMFLRLRHERFDELMQRL